MNKKDDNLESLEQELKALKKKKLQKEIYKLEKELSIVPKTTPAQKKTKPQTTPKTNAQSKIDKILFVICSLLVLVVLLVADLDSDGVSGFNELTGNRETIDEEIIDTDNYEIKNILYRLTCEFINGPKEIGEIEIVYEIINNSDKRVENVELMVTPNIGFLKPIVPFIEPGNSFKRTIQITTGDWSTHTVSLFTDSQVSNAKRITRTKCQTSYEPNS